MQSNTTTMQVVEDAIPKRLFHVPKYKKALPKFSPVLLERACCLHTEEGIKTRSLFFTLGRGD